MKTILVSLWSFPSFKHYGAPASTIMPGLEAALDDTSAMLQQVQSSVETQNPFQAIFVAPEYLFVGGRSTQRRGAMKAGTKDAVVSALASLSKSHPKILIFAGTTFWREDLSTDDAQNKYKANVLAAYMKTTNFGRSKTPNTKVLDGWTNQKTGKSIPGLGDLMGASPQYRAYNTMYAYLNGESAFKPYNKECDFFETGGAQAGEVAYVPGVSGGVREVGKFKFGVEICYDHANNTLKGKKADFHIVASDWVETKPNQCIGGHLLHASSNWQQTGVYLPGNVNRMMPADGTMPKPYEPSFWMLPIDARG